MHAGKRRGIGRGQLFQHSAGMPGVGKVVHRATERLARAQDVRLGDRRIVGAALGEQVAAQERAGALLHQETAFPGMGKVGRVVPAHGVAAEAERLAVGQGAGRPVSQVGDGHHGRDVAAQGRGSGRRREPLVERTALVRFHVGEGDVAQPLRRQDAGDRLMHQGKHPARPGVEQQGLLVDDEVLVEAEAAARQGDRGVDAIDAFHDLGHVGAGLGVGDLHLALLVSAMWSPSPPAPLPHAGEGCAVARERERTLLYRA